MRRTGLLLLFSFLLLVGAASMAFAAAPTITDVSICPGRDTDAPDWAKYHRRAWVRATDLDGAGDIASITITDANGMDHVKTPGCGCWGQEDDYTITASFCQWDLLDPPGGGSYSVVVADASSNTDSLVTAVVPVASDVHPEPVSPAMDSVISDTAPTFSWNAGVAGSSYTIRLEEEGTGGEIWRESLGEPAGPIIEVAYPGELQPNHSYFWTIDSWWPEDVRVTDPRVEIWSTQATGGRFTVYGDWLELPPILLGNLVYEAIRWADESGTYSTTATGYTSDPATRSWLGPTPSASPYWSPDGSKLLLAKAPGIWIDSLDGSDPVLVPGVEAWRADWGPDSERVVYERVSSDVALSDIWVAAIDGSYQYPVVESPDTWDRYPHWSPDGLWIVYRKLPESDPLGLGTHLVRYDGTEDHALVVTGVAGAAYEGAQVSYMGDPAWSPDGLELAVGFSTLKPGGDPDSWDDYVGGIGRISRDGGLITPVFASPLGYDCCAGAMLPWWSPDGTQIGFRSAHHMPLNPEWRPGPGEELGKYEPGVELWLVSADGSGEPTRLTYDYSCPHHASWWAPNTEPETPGDPVTVTAGDTTVTFEGVESGGTTTAITFDVPPGPDPGGFQFLGDFYDITTNATLSPGSTITVQIHYDDADVPGGQEEWLSLLHWEDGAWVDITVRPIDTVNNIITGECTSLSPFGVAFGPQFQGLLSPINNDGTSIFKLNKTVPVKFQLVNPDGSFVADAAAKLCVAKVSNNVVGSYEEPTSTSAADSGNTFRYDADADQYIFNLGTKGLSTGTWALQVTVNGMVAKEVWISLR